MTPLLAVDLALGARMRPMPGHASGVSMFHSQRAHPMSGFWSIRTPDALSNLVLFGGNNKPAVVILP
jgi:hypothetical protein